jgi:hypothetical protein
MKKLGIAAYRCAVGRTPAAKSADASASVQICGRTLSPAANF